MRPYTERDDLRTARYMVRLDLTRDQVHQLATDGGGDGSEEDLGVYVRGLVLRYLEGATDRE